MRISKVNIENYKCFQGKFTLELNSQVNILVGNNESGKSTILEAINLALTGILYGRYLKNELSPYLFNHQTVVDYVQSISDPNGEAQAPPSICIEVFFDSTDAARFEGNWNSEKTNACGVSLKIEFDPDENGWSRDVLALQIKSNLFERQGKAVTNFKHTLPAPQSDLARQTLKAPAV